MNFALGIGLAGLRDAFGIGRDGALCTPDASAFILPVKALHAVDEALRGICGVQR